MTTLIVLVDELSTKELDKIFTDFLEAVKYEKDTSFATRMAVVATPRKGIAYVPPPSAETFAEKAMRKSLGE